MNVCRGRPVARTRKGVSKVRIGLAHVKCRPPRRVREHERHLALEAAANRPPAEVAGALIDAHVVGFPALSLWLPSLVYTHILNAYYFTICIGFLVLAMLAAEWRAIQAEPRRRRRCQACEHPLMRCALGLARWLVAIALVAIIGFSMIPG